MTEKLYALKVTLPSGEDAFCLDGESCVRAWKTKRDCEFDLKLFKKNKSNARCIPVWLSTSKPSVN